MAYLTTMDVVGVVVITGIVIFTGVLFTAGVIDSNTFLLLILALFFTIISKYAAPLMVVGIVKKMYGKGMAAYWNEIKKELLETSIQYEFSFDLRLPEKYMPMNSIPLPSFDLALFEINRDDMVTYAGERLDFITYPYPNQTIFFKPSINKIIGINRKTLDDTIKWIEEHREMFTTEKSQILIPQMIKETTFGDGIPVNVE